MNQLVELHEIEFQGFFQALAAPAAVLDMGFRFANVNPAFEARFGYQRAEVIGKPFLSTIDPSLAATVRNNCDVLRGLEHARHESERRVVTRAGHTFDAVVQISAFTSNDQRQYSVLYQDVQQARERERLLFSRAEMFRLMIEQSPMPISIQDEHWRFLVVNEAYCTFVGYSESELLGRDPLDFLHPASLRDELREQRQAIRGSNLDELPRFSMVRTIVHRDGRLIPYRLELGHSRGTSGSTLWCATLIDLTRLDTTQRQLDAQTRLTSQIRSRFDTFLDSVDEAVIVIDGRSRRILHANAAVQQVFGVDGRDLQYQELSRVWLNVLAKDHERLAAGLRSLVHVRHAEEVVTVQGAQTAESSVRVRMFRDDAKHPEYFLLAEDITASVHQVQDRLQAAIEQRDRLVREVHHRIKNNLQGVSGLIGLTANKQPGMAQAMQEVADRINAIAKVHGLQVVSGTRLVVADVINAIAQSVSQSWNHPVEFSALAPAAAAVWTLDERFGVSLALITNELVTNAVRHRIGDAPAQVKLSCHTNAVQVQVINVGTTKQPIELSHYAGSKTGLDLVAAMMPSSGVGLTFQSRGDSVVVSLRLAAPVVQLELQP